MLGLPVPMYPRKVCPQCNASVHARRSACECCDHVFPSKRKGAKCDEPVKTMKLRRVLESESEKSLRKAKDMLHKASKRALETHEQTLQRRESNRKCTASMRASETVEQTLQRLESDRKRKANIQKRNVSIEQAILSFHSEIKNGPEFVCTCCHRMMYRKSVLLCRVGKYSKCSKDLLKIVFSADLGFPDLGYISNDGNEWVCMTCDRALKRGVMPLQAKANGLKLCELPPELSDLNALELRLICRHVPFMKMVALPSGKQRCIHGPAVNVPSKVDTIVDILPRLPSQSELVPLKLKRKIEYRGHYLYDYVTPQKPLDALRFLKANNPLYGDIDINEEWLEVAIANDTELSECLLMA